LLSRRRLLTGIGAGIAAPAVIGAARPQVVVVGGGFGGATCARYLSHYDPRLDVTLIDPAATFITCPMSNRVIAGQLDMAAISMPLDQVGTAHVRATALAVDANQRTVHTTAGDVPYDRLVLAPGVKFHYDGIDGEPRQFLHAWKAGGETLALRDALKAMRQGGVFAIAVPENPYRCPPGPYERASLAAQYLSRHNPRAKVLILDAKDDFTKRALFQEAWQALYPGMIEWLPRAASGTVVAVRQGRFITDFDEHRVDVGNLIPPQRAATIAGPFDGGRGWCEVDARTFESRVAPRVHLVGDAINAAPMPKSAFAANNQAKVCAAAIVALLNDRPPPAPLLMNTCYSLAAADYGFSVSGVYEARGTRIAQRTGGQSDLGAPPSTRRQAAHHAMDWMNAISRDSFGVGDAARGRAVAFDRERGDCAICHELPGLDATAHGDLGPSLTRVGERLDARTLRQRVADPRRDNPASVMPAYARQHGFHRPAPEHAGRSVLRRSELDDLTAYLATLRGEG